MARKAGTPPTQSPYLLLLARKLVLIFLKTSLNLPMDQVNCRSASLHRLALNCGGNMKPVLWGSKFFLIGFWEGMRFS